jgi:hypothetical protein
MAKIVSQKRTILAFGVIAVAVELIAMVALPAYTANAQADFKYALNGENWAVSEESVSAADAAIGTIHTVVLTAKGYAFERIDEQTLKQYKAEMNLTIQVDPKTETATWNVDVTGYVKVNEAIYTIESGTAALGTKRHVLFIRCEGVDENGNAISLKVGATYFWWGGKAYALRSKALLQTADKPMLLLERGIAKIR